MRNTLKQLLGGILTDVALKESCREPLSPPLPLQINRIHGGDALQLVPDVPDGSVDLIVCDGPYGARAMPGIKSPISRNST